MSLTPPVYTPDGKVTSLLAHFDATAEQVQAAIRVCVANDAADVLPILGVTK